MWSMLTPLLLAIIIALLLITLLSWSFRRAQNHKASAPWLETHGDLQMWLLVLAAFIMGIFLAYVLFALPPGGR